MSTIKTLVEPGETRHSEPRPYRGWLLRVFPKSSQSSIALRALVLSVAILGLEYLVEVEWRAFVHLEYYTDFWGGYTFLQFLADPIILSSWVGLIFTLILLGQWGTRYVELWEEVGPAFDVSRGQYDAEVDRNLVALYGRDYVPFLVFALFQVVVYWLFRWGIPAGFFHVGFLQFFAVTVLYCCYRHTVTIRRVTNHDRVGVADARPVLTKIADFGVVVGLVWFAALTPLVVWVTLAMLFVAPAAITDFLADPTAAVWLFYALVVLFLVIVGILIFCVPLLLLHEALAAAKHNRLRRLDTEYETLFEAWRTDGLEGDPSVGLDILEKRRRNVETQSTWPYRLVSTGELLLVSVSAIVPVTLSVVQAFGLVS